MDQGDKQKKPRTRRGSKAGKQRRDAERQAERRRNAASAGGPRPAVKVITVPITTGPKKASSPAKLEDLATVALNTSLPLEKRLAPLQQLENILSTVSGQQRASRFIDGISVPLLQLLWDDNSIVSSAAVATLTAWVTTPRDSIGSSSGGGAGSSTAAPATTEHPGVLILNLLLPILSSRKYPVQFSATPAILTNTWKIVAPHQLASLLIICRECLAKVPGLAAFKASSALFTAARGIVEELSAPASGGGASVAEENKEGISTLVIGPAFELLVQAMKVHHVPHDTALSLGNTVIRWAHRSDVPGSIRPVMARVMHAVGAAWSTGSDPAGGIGPDGEKIYEENNFLRLLEEITDLAMCCSSSLPSSPCTSVHLVLNLTACAVPLIVRASSLRGTAVAQQGRKEENVENSTGWSGTVEARVALMIHTMCPIVVAAGEKKLMKSEEVRELCKYVHAILSAALKTPPPANENLGAAAAGRPSLLTRPAVENEKEEKEPTASATIESNKASTKEKDPYVLLTAGITLYNAALQHLDIQQDQDISSSLTKDLLSWISQIPRETPFSERMEAAVVQLAMPPDGPLSLLRVSSSPAVVQPVALLYVQLLTRLPTLLHAIIDEIKVAFCFEGSNASKRAFDVNVLLAALKAGFPKDQENEFWRPVWPAVAELLLFYSNAAQEQRANLKLDGLVPKLVQIAQLALAVQPQEIKEEKKDEEGKKWCQALQLAGQLLESTPKFASQMLRWQVQIIPKVFLTQENDVEAVLNALQGAKTRVRHPEPQIRLVAFSLLEAILEKNAEISEFAGKILDVDEVIEVCEAAFLGAEDTDQKVAQQAKRVVQVCSVPIAFSLLSGGRSTVLGNISLLQPTKETLDSVIEPRQRGFSPSQLSQVLDFIAGSALASVLVGGGQAAQKGAESPPDEWLVHLVQEMEVLKYTEEEEAGEEGGSASPKTTTTITSAPQPRSKPVNSSPAASAASLWWLVIQTAAKQCVESKLITHWGGAAQTLGTLERAVQKLSSSRGKSGNSLRGIDFDFSASRNETAKIQQGVAMTPGMRLAGICLLHFLFALEQELGAAITGSLVRCPPNKNAALYFSGNKKVCQEWLARVRPAAATAAADLELYHLAVYHSVRRLESLKRQADELKARNRKMIQEEEQQKELDRSKVEEDEETTTKARGCVLSDRKEEETKLALLKRPKQDEKEQQQLEQGPRPGAALLGNTSIKLFGSSSSSGGGGSSNSNIISRFSPLKSPLKGGDKSKNGAESSVQEKIEALEKSVNETTSQLTFALSALHESDSIAGIHAVCTHIATSVSSSSPSSPSAFDWIRAAELFASGNYEGALEVLSTLNKQIAGEGPRVSISSSSSAVVVGAEAYVGLHDWEGLQQWLKEAPPGSLDQPGVQHYADMATWGLDLCSLSISKVPPPDEETITAAANAISNEIGVVQYSLSSTATALEALSTFAKTGNQAILSSASKQIIENFILAPSFVGEFGLLSKFALPGIAENIGALAALHLASNIPQQAQHGGDILYSAGDFSAWNGGIDFSCPPAAMNIAENILTASTAAAVGGAGVESDNIPIDNSSLLAVLKLSTGAVAQATGNFAIAKKMYASVEKIVLADTSVGVDIESSLRMHQKRASSSISSSSSSAMTSPPELVQLYKEVCASSDSSEFRLREDIIGQNASICWQYAQYIKTSSEESREEGTEIDTACLGGLAAAAKALSLAGLSLTHQQPLNILPIVLFILRTLVDNADVISAHENTVLTSLDQVPALSWRLVIPQLISLLTTSPIPALRLIASHLLLKTAGAAGGSGASPIGASSVSDNDSDSIAPRAEDPTCVLLPAMVELQRQQQQQQHRGAISEATITSSSTAPPLSSELQSLVNALRAKNPSLCEDLYQFIHAMASLALLEDERWHAVLFEAQGTLTKRLAASYAYLKTLRKDPSDPFTAVFIETATEEVACAVAPVLAALRCHVAAAEKAIENVGKDVEKEGSENNADVDSVLFAVTPHERQFREKVNLLPKLKWMVEQLERPLELVAADNTKITEKQSGVSSSTTTNAAAAGVLESALQRPLQVIKKIASEIATNSMKVTELELKDVCPTLAAFTLGGGSGGSIGRKPRLRVPQGALGAGDASAFPLIESIESQVKVLHTKTRPKKITLRGTDGNTYSFLVKGREDLRVDQAVSSFFAAADAALAVRNRKKGRSSSAAVMPLTVVPVGPQAGLVGWVERTKPLYEVYASYEAQQAQRAAWLAAAALAQSGGEASSSGSLSSLKQQQQKKSQRGGGNSGKKSNDGPELTRTQKKKNKKAEKEAAAAAAAAAASALEKHQMRPADHFRAKIKAAGVNTSSPRSSWPLEALRSVFLDLSTTAPHNMIANELLYSAAGAAHWWSRQQNYTTSTAIMSIFGYLLGLGDRHLDNVLLQAHSGAVLHVDFGVLFDRGSKLHVPEVVPFRLTQSFVAGLGVTGVEGKFKKDAEAAVVAVRSNRQSLSMLLQSVVEDPLIAWAPEVGTKAARIAFERCVELMHFIQTMEKEKEEKEENGSIDVAVAAAVKDAALVLHHLSTDLSPFCSLFSKVEKALATVSEHQQQLDQCTRVIEEGEVEDAMLQNSITATAAEIEDLQRELDSALHNAALLEAANPSYNLYNTNKDGTAINESPYSGVLAAVFEGHLAAALHSAVPAWDPSLAAVPLGIVQSYGSSELTLVNVALGMQPSSVPLTASLLLKAATVDDVGKQALQKGAVAIRGALAAVQHYTNAVAAINNTTIGNTSLTNTFGDGTDVSASAPLYYTLLTQSDSTSGGITNSSTANSTAKSVWSTSVDPIADSSSSPSSTSSSSRDVLSTWNSLKIHSKASTSFVKHLTETQNSLTLERVDVALAAVDAKEQLAALVSTLPPSHVATALGKFTLNEAENFRVLAMAFEPSKDVFDVVQRMILGYATVVLTADEAAVIVGAPDSFSSAAAVFENNGEFGSLGETITNTTSTTGNWLMSAVPWLTHAVHAADSINSIAGEMQLLVPHLSSLLASSSSDDDNVDAETNKVSDLSKAFSTIKENLEKISKGIFPSIDTTNAAPPLSVLSEVEEEVSAAVMGQLVDISNTWPVIGSLIQGLHAAQAAATTSATASLASATGDAENLNVIIKDGEGAGPVLSELRNKQSEVSSSHWECLELAAAAVDLWNSLIAAATRGGRGSSASASASNKVLSSSLTDTEIDTRWQSISSSIAASVSSPVVLHLLPAVHAVMIRTADEFRKQAENLPSTVPPAAPAVKKNATVVDTASSSTITGVFDTFEAPAPAADSAAGEERVPLPAFFDYLDDDDDNGMLLEQGLEGALGSLTLEEEDEAEENVDQGINASLSSSSLLTPEQSKSWNTFKLKNALSACSDTSGALAAVDAVLHNANTTIHPATQQAQQALVDLAAHQWLYEPVLLNSKIKNSDGITITITSEDLKKALQEESSTTGSNSSFLFKSSAASLLPSPVDLALSALLTPRYEVLSNLKMAVIALNSAEEEIQNWKNVAAPIENLFASELLRIAPAAAANIHVCLQAGYEWKNTAAMHTRHLKDALQALVECETARDAAAKQKEEGKEEGNADSGGVNNEASIKLEKEREEYRAAVDHVHTMRAALSAAQSSFTQHQQELDTLRREVKQAVEDVLKFEKQHAAAVEAVSNVALPLVKATQKLPATLQTIQNYVDTASPGIELLSTLQRRLSRVQAAARATAGSSGVGGGESGSVFQVQISKILQNLSSSVDSLRILPTVPQTMQYSVDAARRFLLQHGGRGIAAAREQAGGVVQQCKNAMEKVQPLIQTAELDAAKLPLVSPLVGDLISLAKAEIDELCTVHEFECTSRGVAFPLSRCGASVHLYPSPKNNISAQAASVFAAAAMQQFEKKIKGTGDSLGKRLNEGNYIERKKDGGGDGEFLNVSKYVSALIEEARSVDNLARMFEGWMPWV